MIHAVALAVLSLASAPVDPPEAPDPAKAEPPKPAAPAGLPAPPKRYSVARAAGPLKLDGKLDDAAWAKAAWTDDFVDIEGDRKPRPRYRTRAKMLWDERYFYIAAEMEEPDVWATYRTRDMIVFHENDFEVFIDPDGDTRQYYELEVNCLGTIFDLFLCRRYKDGGPAVHPWDAKGLVTAIDVQGSANDPRDDDRGWTLEWAIPWSSLVPPEGVENCPCDEEKARNGAVPKPGDTWRLNFSRVQWKHDHEELDADGKRIGPKRGPTPPTNDSIRQSPPAPYAKRPNTPEDNWVWSPQWVIDMHEPARWGYVMFAE